MMTAEDRLLSALIRDSLKPGDRFQATITSDSMAPLLRQADEITVEVTSLLIPGDIAVFYRGRYLIAHRYWAPVQAGGTGYLLLKGDHRPYFDSPVAPADIVGRLTSRRRHDRVLSFETLQTRRLNRLIFDLHRLESRLTGNQAPASGVAGSQPRSPSCPSLPRRLLNRLLRSATYRTAVLILAISQPFNN